jgi:hypothetical protein
VKLESITQAIREEISKLNQVLHLLDVSGGKKENFSGTESPVEESQGSKEIEKSPDLV